MASAEAASASAVEEEVAMLAAMNSSMAARCFFPKIPIPPPFSSSLPAPSPLASDKADRTEESSQEDCQIH
eukprot:15361808-Ditylum_brightwellii.AAC.1